MPNAVPMPRLMKVAIVIVYGLVIPLLAVSIASAAWSHTSKWKVNGVWINFVDNNEHLRFFDQTQYDNYTYGKNKWDRADKVRLSWNQNDWTLVIYDGTSCSWDYLAQTVAGGSGDPNYIENNRCLMDWEGGAYPGYNYRDTDPTRESRWDRTGAHELGHALGFRHWYQDGQPCDSVMSQTLSARRLGGCDYPTQDDKEELQGWNY